jgi:FKBP-type peptidyl-prolyl cis-trans isomerase FklB
MQTLFRKQHCVRNALSIAAVLVAGLAFAPASLAQQSQTTASSAKPAARPATPHSAASHTTQSTAKRTPAALPTDKDKTSYALGTNIGRQLADQHLTTEMIKSPAFLRGFRDALSGTQPLMSDEQIHAALDQLQVAMKASADAATRVAGEENLKEGQEFLAKNKVKEGVVALPSGLQYKVITMGTGPKPTAADTVVCDYRGTLINGKEFDSSSAHGGPATFPVSGVIKGWTEALQMMPVGSKWELFIPAELAYGSRSAGPMIGPNSTLVFEVELHSIKGK